jgi:hypothetical protein
MNAASTLYQRFRGTVARKMLRIGIRYGKRWITARGAANILIPHSLAVIGHVNAIEYDCTRNGKTVKARHVFAPGSRPVFAVGSGRGELFLVGTRYRFTDRGIVDFDDAGRAIDYHEDSGKTKLLKGF